MVNDTVLKCCFERGEDLCSMTNRLMMLWFGEFDVLVRLLQNAISRSFMYTDDQQATFVQERASCRLAD